MRGRPKTQYMVVRDGIATGKTLYSDEITAIFGIDQRNISKYVNGKIHAGKWTFFPVYEEEKATKVRCNEWDSVTKTITKEEIYFVCAKAECDLADFTIKPSYYKVRATSKKNALRKTEEILGSGFVAIDASTSSAKIGLTWKSNVTALA